MARFYGTIGFTFGTVEKSPGIWKDRIITRNYYGDTMRRRVTWHEGQKVNDDVKINHQISILADEYAEENAYLMKWVLWKGIKWKVESIEFERPRIILTLGDRYPENEEIEENQEEENNEHD